MNEQFGRYVKRTGFNLTLTKDQMNELLFFAYDSKYYYNQLDQVCCDSMRWGSTRYGLWGIKDKGLLFRNPELIKPPHIKSYQPGIGGLTKAGQLVVKLLEEAGLTDDRKRTDFNIYRYYDDFGNMQRFYHSGDTVKEYV